MHLRRTLLPAIFAVVLATPAVAQPYHFRWDGASGLLPNQGCPFWTHVDNSAATAVLSGGVLTLATTSFAGNNLYYDDAAPDVVVPNPWIIEWRGRFVSESSNHPSRSAMMVTPFIGGNIGIGMGIAADRVFINSADLTVGSQVTVDTNDAFHTYRLVIVGTNVQVFYDGTHVLTGTMYGISGSPVARLDWGEASVVAFGVSEWLYFEHNGSNASCVTPTRESTWGRVKSLYR